MNKLKELLKYLNDNFIPDEDMPTVEQLITTYTTRKELEARIGEILLCRNEVEDDSPVNVYDKLSERCTQLSTELENLKGGK